ncbi:putative hemerythrin-like protein [Caenispirillum salinarum AK4]|uniref:Putative hemerythrin-like protein n=1 Tax=Caenispirillum salinarum AK4 TaxID=1238182 RepID=K9GUK0_9PROT|nr:hemerythrin domain-containing protein [Caenispirillum salinarum]EKV28434.1 putative hemerythrin-like protein [Caenispirillum salinarum AK4]
MQWTETLRVGVGFIDADHEDFITLLNTAKDASDVEFPAAFQALAEHTRAHFAREEALMDATGFFATDIHKGEHARVLAEVGHFAEHLERGNIAFVRAYVAERLPDWFIQHRNTMDQATAAHAARAGHADAVPAD